MSFIAGASAHGSPGVTTALTIMAAAWPGGPAPIVVEADSAGGVLAARYHLARSPGFGTLTNALRYGEAFDAHDHCQMLPSGVPAIVGATSASTAASQLRSAAAELVPWLAGHERLALVDLGSLLPWAPTASLASEAELMLWFVRPTAEELRLLYTRHNEVASAPEAGIILVGDGPYDAVAVADAFAMPVFGAIPQDHRGVKAATLGGDDRFLRRSPLTRACRSLARKAASTIGDEHGPAISETAAPSSLGDGADKTGEAAPPASSQPSFGTEVAEEASA